MSGTGTFGFGKSIPGFEFLQQLAQGPGGSVGSGLHPWVAPTVDVEVLEQRIGELKAVQFWLEQNLLALKATVQALEVQKMTLSTLRGMNMNMSEVAKAFAMPQAAAGLGDAAAPVRWPFQNMVPEPEPETEASPASAPSGGQMAADAMQWWGALTQQFQQIAQQTLGEAARQMPQAMEQMMAASAMPGAGATGKKPASAAKKSATARKTSPKKTSSKTAAKPDKASASAGPLAGNWPLPPSSGKRSAR